MARGPALRVPTGRTGVAAAAVALAATAALVPLLLAVACLAAGGLTLVLARRRRARARAELARAATTEFVVALSGELRAGRPAAHALAASAEDAGPLQPSVAAAAEAVRLGADPAAELRELARSPGAGTLTAVAACWSAASGVGAPVADVLSRVVLAVDAQSRLASDLDGALAGSRATVRVLLALPAFGLLLGASLGAPVGHVLLGTPLGRLLLVGAAGLDLAGVAWMRALARRALAA